jgi:predicted HTH domain antitoxin
MQIKETRIIKRDVIKVAFDVRKPSLDEKRVVLFQKLIQAHVSFPPIKTYEKNGDEHLYVWEGRHRLEAYKREEIAEFDVEVCTFDSDQEMYFEAFKANMIPGGGPKVPSYEDYKFFARERMKDNMSQDAIVIELVKIGVDRVFADTVVRDSIKSDKTQRIEAAMEAFKTGEVTINSAAKRYGVSPAELKKRLNTPDLSVLEDYCTKLVSGVKREMDKLIPVIAAENEELEGEAFDVMRRKLSELQRYIDANDPTRIDQKRTKKTRAA